MPFTTSPNRWSVTAQTDLVRDIGRLVHFPTRRMGQSFTVPTRLPSHENANCSRLPRQPGSERHTSQPSRARMALAERIDTRPHGGSKTTEDQRTGRVIADI